MVERNYYDQPAVDRLAALAEYDLDNTPMDALIARLTGRSPERARDLVEALHDRRQVDLKAAAQHRLSLARAEKAAEHEERMAAWEFTHMRMADSRRRLEEARTARELATDNLREACLKDESAMADVRRKVRS